MSLLSRNNRKSNKNNTEVKTKSDIIDALETWAKMPTFATAVGVVIEPKLDKMSQRITKLEADLATAKDAWANQPSKPPTTTTIKQKLPQSQVANTEKSERLRILRISGLPDDPKMAKEKFLEASKTMAVALTPTDFSIAMTESKSGKKTAIVKFMAIWKRKEIYRARAKLQGTGVYLSEHLDKVQQDIFYKCRCLVRDQKLYRAWSFDLDIYVKRSVEDKPILISKDDDLTQFLLDDTTEDTTPSLSRASSKFLAFSDQAVATATQSNAALTSSNDKKIASLEKEIKQLKQLNEPKPGTSKSNN